MRLPKILLTSLAVAAWIQVGAVYGAGTARSAEPVKIRLSWIAPVTNWAVMLPEKKELGRFALQAAERFRHGERAHA